MFYGAPCVADGRVFVGTLDWAGTNTEGVFAFDAATGKRLWSHSTKANILTRLLHANGKVIVHDVDWNFQALDPATGRELWHFNALDTVGLLNARLGHGKSAESKTAMTYDPKSNQE